MMFVRMAFPIVMATMTVPAIAAEPVMLYALSLVVFSQL